MAELLTRAESNALFDILWRAERDSDENEDKVLYRRIADKLDSLIVEGGVAEFECVHPHLRHADASAVIAFCPDCELEFLCMCEECVK